MTWGAHVPSASRIGCVAVSLAGLLYGSAYASQRDVDVALASMASEVAEVRRSCTEPIAVAANEVSLSNHVTGVHVVLTQPLCLGEWGTYDYLLVKGLDGRWQSILGGPGPIRFSHPAGSRVARIDVSAMMGCELTFTWNGTTYVRHGSPECAGGHKGAEWAILERVMRAEEH